MDFYDKTKSANYRQCLHVIQLNKVRGLARGLKNIKRGIKVIKQEILKMRILIYDVPQIEGNSSTGNLDSTSNKKSRHLSVYQASHS